VFSEIVTEIRHDGVVALLKPQEKQVSCRDEFITLEEY